MKVFVIKSESEFTVQIFFSIYYLSRSCSRRTPSWSWLKCPLWSLRVLKVRLLVLLFYFNLKLVLFSGRTEGKFHGDPGQLRELPGEFQLHGGEARLDGGEAGEPGGEHQDRQSKIPSESFSSTSGVKPGKPSDIEELNTESKESGSSASSSSERGWVSKAPLPTSKKMKTFTPTSSTFLLADGSVSSQPRLHSSTACRVSLNISSSFPPRLPPTFRLTEKVEREYFNI